MLLSIIIPVYNECTKIQTDIKAANQFLIEKKWQGEIIIVDDGSVDNTAEIASQTHHTSNVSLKIIRSDHHGKGNAVRTGISQSRGKYVMFVDSGYCVTFDHACHALQLLEDNICDIAHGSRRLEESVIIRDQTLVRRIIAKIMRYLFILLFHIPKKLTDTQCGFKLYKGDVARKIFSQCISNGFLFEIEIIKIAYKTGYRIVEFPIKWKADLDSTISPFKSSFRIVGEMISLYRRFQK